jgi:hypothetical protein
VTHQEAIDTLASERYLLNDMSGEDRLAYEDHFFSCETCAGDLRSAAAMLEGARSGFAGRRPPARVVALTPKTGAGAPRTWWRSAALPWAAAAALACVAVYQSVRVGPSQRLDSSPVALVPVALHAASRGAEAVVPLDAGARLVSLALDVNDAQSGELTFELATSEGRLITSGRVAAPAPGTPLLLLLPSSTLAAPAHYVLSLGEAGTPPRPLGEYRFALLPR